jgi:protein-tyrosine phosphatase
MPIWSRDNADAYAALGLKTIIDLRATQETKEQPSAWSLATGARLIHLPLGEGGEGDATGLMRRLFAGELRSFSVDDLTRFYAATVRREARNIGRALEELSRQDSLPALVHCAAGKDRTGLLIAFVLEALDVPRETVVADYAMTELLRPNRVAKYSDILERFNIPPHAVGALFGTPPRAMSELLAGIDAEFGGVEEFLCAAAGLSPEVLLALHEALIEPTSSAT